MDKDVKLYFGGIEKDYNKLSRKLVSELDHMISPDVIAAMDEKTRKAYEQGRKNLNNLKVELGDDMTNIQDKIGKTIFGHGS